MAIRRFEYTPTPTDERSVTDQSWKTISHVKIAEEKGEGGIDRKPTLIERWTQPSVLGLSDPVNWKPLSMTTPILSAIIIITLLMIVGIELLAQKSAQQGGLALSPSLDEIPQWARISSEYVPQVLAVAYSLVWSWVDLDVKRMQPWFELSKPEGATGRESLLLDYPFTFVAFVPFVALKRKHWMAFLSGTAMVLVFWAITPLQSAQLGTGEIRRTVTQNLAKRSVLVPLDEQTELIDPQILTTGYSVAWLKQPMPPFTTRNQAFLPFFPEDSRDSPSSDGNWTASTTRLTTSLECWPAQVFGSSQGGTHFFLNGQGCNASVIMPTTSEYSMFYIGYYGSAYSSFWLGSKTCPHNAEVEHQFLATWSHGNFSSQAEESQGNITGVYCQSSYFKEPVTVTVDARSREPDEETIQSLGPKEVLSVNEFNSTAFEFLIANGMSEVIKKRDHPFNTVVDQHPKLEGRDLAMPVSSMVGFAVAGSNISSQDYSNPEVLGAAYERAHQYLFSIAISRLVMNSTDLQNATMSSTSLQSGIIVSRPISIALESLLLLIAIFTVAILLVSRKSHTNLQGNPSSINRIAEVVRDSPELIDLFCTIDNADEDSLTRAVGEHKFRFRWNHHREASELQIEKPSVQRRLSDAKLTKGFYDPVKPAALRTESGITFVLAVMGVMGGLAYLKWAEIEFSGLKRPSQNQEVQQILENYIPTILSTLIEPFWVLVNRLLCVLQPFNDLWRGQATQMSSVAATYTSIPPQFALLRAFKAKHLGLITACSMVFLTNILTISLPAVFQEREVTARYVEDFTPTIGATFNNESIYDFATYITTTTISSGYSDHGFSALANMTEGTPLIPWVSSEYFFQPAKVDSSRRKDKADFYTIQTRGFGVKSNCAPVSSHVFPLEPRAEPSLNPDATACNDDLAYARTKIRETTFQRENGTCAIEYVATPTRGKVIQCDDTLTLGWARIEDANDVNGTIQGSFVVCKPYIQTGLFDVRVDPAGYVQSYEAAGELESSLGYEQGADHVEQLLAQFNLILYGYQSAWHNSTLTVDWLNYLMVTKTGSRDIVDPHKPVPDAKAMVELVEPIYQTLFALLLGLNQHLFNPADSSKIVQGHRLVEETRLFLDQAAFIISMVLLGINIVVASFLYFKTVAFVLPIMPTTLGSIIAYVAPSRLLAEKVESLETLCDKTYSFGRFIGHDGETHIGVELDPHVVPIEPASLGKRSRKCWGKARHRKVQKPYRRDPWV